MYSTTRWRWTAGPARPIPYRLAQRVQDRRAGRRDASRETPSPHPAPTAETASPYESALRARALDRAAREELRADARTAGLREQIAMFRVLVAEAEVDHERASAVVRTRTAGPPEAGLRRGPAEQDADEHLVRVRRQREWSRRSAGLLAEERAAASRLVALRTELAAATGAIAVTDRATANRVRRLHQHTDRRCWTYRRQLVLHQRATSRPPALLGTPLDVGTGHGTTTPEIDAMSHDTSTEEER